MTQMVQNAVYVWNWVELTSSELELNCLYRNWNWSGIACIGIGIGVELPLSELELDCKNGIDPSSDRRITILLRFFLLQNCCGQFFYGNY